MFLSVIVSCHNCKEYIRRVLNSLVIQNFSDLEVILSDDHSTDNFMEVVEPYKQLLDIKYFLTNPHKYHCPGNTRLDGWSHASGDWITFMDHDDAFLPGSFQLVYDTISKSEIKYPFMYSPVSQVNSNGNELSQLDAITWLHGNFYNRQWLIDHQINFKEDLFGNEDLYFNNLVYGTLTGTGSSYWTVHKPLYQWYSIPESLSNKTPDGTDCGYTEKYFGDYLTANFEPHVRMLAQYPKEASYFKNNILRLFIYSYFYYERAIFLFKDKTVLDKMIMDISNTFNLYQRSLNGNKDQLLEYVFSNPDAFIEQRESIFKLSGKFVETHSFKEFLNTLSNGKSSN